MPIVAFIDELDRVEDAEVRTVAQLVRSVADFPGISYVLAYDVERVVQALGGGSEPEQVARGRGYLEKIVQLQIPLPITLAEEIRQLLHAELQSIAGDIHLPENWPSIPRYGELIDKIVPEVVTTPRDIKRLVGTYHALASMLENEVDWVDLLAFSALMVKAPGTIENIRRAPEDVVNNPLSAGTSMRRFIENREKKDRLKDVIAKGEGGAPIEEVLIHLFPALKRDSHRHRDQSADSLCMRRPLLTTLRLGLLPGGYSRSSIQTVFDKAVGEIEDYLRQLFREDAIAPFLDRLSEVYPILDDVDDASFWRAVDRFVEKPDCEWITSYSQMHAVTRELSDIFGSRVDRSKSFEGAKIFQQALDGGRIALVSNLLRSQIFAHGLFGHQKRYSTRTVFLTAEDTERISLELSSKFKERHLHGQFISCLWSLEPVYTMLDNKTWDEDCKAQARRQIDDPAALDAWAVLLFGAHYYTEGATIESIMGLEDYVNAAKARSESPSIQDAHETVRLALAKGFRGNW